MAAAEPLDLQLAPTGHAGDFVAFTGEVHLHTALGIFLDVDGRRVFVPANFISRTFHRFTPGQTVTIEVLRSFAEQERLGGSSPRG